MAKLELNDNEFSTLIETWQFFKDHQKADLLKRFLATVARGKNLVAYQDMVEKLAGPPRKGGSESEQIVFVADVEATLANFKDLQSEIQRRVTAVGGVSAASSKVGIAQPTISRFLGMKVTPRYATIQRIAKAFNLVEFPKRSNRKE